MLADFEDRIASMFEGVAGSLFRSPVEPVQIAKSAEREMLRNKLVGTGRAYMPTLYTVLLSPGDDGNLSSFYPTLSGEFATYLTGKAQEAGLVVTTAPLVRFMIDDELKTGRFAVFAENVSEEEVARLRNEAQAEWGVPLTGSEPGMDLREARRASARQEGHWDASRQEPAPVTEETHPAQRPGAGAAIIDLATERRIPLVGDEIIVGRTSSANIVVNDINVSRDHARFIHEGGGWAVEDMGSTNGTWVNDRRVNYLRLVSGDMLTFGVTKFEFREG